MRVEAAVARAKLPVAIVASLFSASVVLAFVMDQVKVWLFARFKMAWRCAARYLSLLKTPKAKEILEFLRHSEF
jgi:hypothetical protein